MLPSSPASGAIGVIGIASPRRHVEAATCGGGFLARAFSTPIVLGIVIGYVAGKSLGIGAASWLSTRLNRHAPGPPIGWLALAGGGSIAGVGFTVSLPIAGIAFRGDQLAEAKLGVLTARTGRVPAVLDGVPCSRAHARPGAGCGRARRRVSDS